MVIEKIAQPDSADDVARVVYSRHIIGFSVTMPYLHHAERW
jgi:hypothetical protein